MPRTEKSTMKSKSAWPNGLRFLASLFFLFVLFGGSSAGTGWWSPWVTAGAGSLWLPILFAIAVLSSIGLFFSSLAALVVKSSMGMGGKLGLAASFSLVALTVSPSWSGIFWVVILGFILSWVANAIDWM
jgi:hypothetical protein